MTGSRASFLSQTDAAKQQYTMRRVELVRRFEKSVFVRSRSFGKDEELTAEEKELSMLPKQPLLPGERILGTGVGELKSALMEKESQPQKDAPAQETRSPAQKRAVAVRGAGQCRDAFRDRRRWFAN